MIGLNGGFLSAISILSYSNRDPAIDHAISSARRAVLSGD